ncbi:MAG: DUF6395 domain-containing protein [Candidatus Thermoplasmatota archaeon]|nr:DUF6395 domain-containing protein [Candidatus Thermoplasmatota archaeon]
MVELGGWAITEQVYGLIRYMLPSESTIVEFGSGEGTILLTRNYDVYSIEHDEEFLGIAPMSTYIHAPIREYDGIMGKGWYDADIIQDSLPPDYDLILVDGPPGSIGRDGIIQNLDLLDLSKIILVDDVNRSVERNLAIEIADRVGSIPIVFGDGKRECSLIFNFGDGGGLSIDMAAALNTSNHRLRIGPFTNSEDAEKFRAHLEENFGWVIYTRKFIDGDEEKLELVTGVFHGIEPAIQRAINLKSEYQYQIEIISEMAIPEPDLDEVKGYDPHKLWRQEGTRLYLQTPWEEIHFEMPDDWSIDRTHPDLFKVSEFVLMHPWVDGILDDWEPSRKAGERPGLAFSGGIDSAAAMLLLPSDTVLIYNERDFKSGIKHENAFRFIDYLQQEHGRDVVKVKSNHELIRTHHGKMAGFSTDYACAVQVILLADYFNLDSVATGMPLENSYLFHGYKYRDFSKTWFWRLYGSLFDSIGLPILQPVAGLSEVINQRIVDENGMIEFAQSCLRSTVPGEVCGKCWKCFRKNTLAGHPWQMSREIKKFLTKSPMKQAASTIYAFQKMGGRKGSIPRNLRGFEQVVKFWNVELSWLDCYLPEAIDLIPVKYQKGVLEKLSLYAKPMEEPYPIIGFHLYPELD